MMVVILSNTTKYGANLAIIELLCALPDGKNAIIVIPSNDFEFVKSLNKLGFHNIIQLSFIGIYSEFKRSKLQELRLVVSNLYSSVVFFFKLIVYSSKLKAVFRKNSIIVSNSSTILVGYFISRISGLRHVWFLREAIICQDGCIQLSQYHGVSLLSPWLHNKFLESSKVIFISNYLKSSYLNCLRFNTPKDILTLRDGIAAPRLHAIDSRLKREYYRFGMPGVFHINKGQLFLLDVIKVYLENYEIDNEKIRFIFFGPGQHPKMLRRINELHIEKYVELRDFTDRDELFSEIDVLIMASRNEALGRVTVEAMMCGKLVLGLDSGATSELIVHGETGYLFRDDADLLALLHSIQNGERKQEIEMIIETAKDFAMENFDIDRYTKRIQEFIFS